MHESEIKQRLIAALDALAESPKLKHAKQAAGIDVRAAIKQSEAGDKSYLVKWRDGSLRQFAELVPIAERIGIVKREQERRAVTIDGEPQFVKDPALLARFGDDKHAAELHGYADFPFAHDIAGNRIPLLSARHPRPQRRHRPHPPIEGGRKVPTIVAVGQHGLPLYQSHWQPAPPPPYARGLKTPAPPPQVRLPSPAKPRPGTNSPLRRELLERLKTLKEHGPQHPKPIDVYGRPTIPQTYRRQRTDDPAENIG